MFLMTTLISHCINFTMSVSVDINHKPGRNVGNYIALNTSITIRHDIKLSICSKT